MDAIYNLYSKKARLSYGFDFVRTPFCLTYWFLLVQSQAKIFLKEKKKKKIIKVKVEISNVLN